MNYGYLYIISNTAWPSWIKVGSTSNIKNRLNTYQTSSPFRNYVLIFLIKIIDYKDAERDVRDFMRPFAKSIKNEWFEVDQDIAKSQLEFIKDKYTILAGQKVQKSTKIVVLPH